jgi:hypothetical protein
MPHMVVEAAVGFDDLDKLFQVLDLLDNQDELIKQFRPELLKLIVNKQFFKGHFQKAYLDAFDERVVKLIKTEVVGHFPDFTPEDVLTICDVSFLKMMAPDLFDQDKYTKEGK